MDGTELVSIFLFVGFEWVKKINGILTLFCLSLPFFFFFVETKSHQGGGGSGMDAPEPLTKKQRENRTRTARKKELKAEADALQEQRLRQHQRQLEQERIKAFYATGAGKHTQWGSKPKNNPPGSSKVPTGKAGLNEFGQLIWD